MGRTGRKEDGRWVRQSTRALFPFLKKPKKDGSPKEITFQGDHALKDERRISGQES